MVNDLLLLLKYSICLFYLRLKYFPDYKRVTELLNEEQHKGATDKQHTDRYTWAINIIKGVDRVIDSDNEPYGINSTNMANCYFE